ncbi:MAG: putative toxin-antitoxin system toxin component, PIN family [Methylococcaceae bacterium]
MKNKIRVVIDTNVIISAVLLPHSISRRLFDFVVLNGELLVSEDTLTELNDVLSRPKFNKYVLEENRLEFFSALVRVAKVVQITQVITACRDSKDSDFYDKSVLLGHPPKIIGIRRGNCSNRQLELLLRNKVDAIKAFNLDFMQIL